MCKLDVNTKLSPSSKANTTMYTNVFAFVMWSICFKMGKIIKLCVKHWTTSYTKPCFFFNRKLPWKTNNANFTEKQTLQISLNDKYLHIKSYVYYMCCQLIGSIWILWSWILLQKKIRKKNSVLHSMLFSSHAHHILFWCLWILF